MIPEFLGDTIEAYKASGLFGAMAVFIYGFMTAWKSALFQKFLPSSLEWKSWKPTVKWLFVITLSGLSGVFLVLAGSGAWIPTIMCSITAGLAAMGLKASKSALDL